MFTLSKNKHLFRKDIEPRCAYCENSKKIYDDKLVCSNIGIVSEMSSCKKFVYNPLKRTPPKPAAMSTRFSELDFILD